MLERFEFIAGWHGQQELCFGCDKLNQQMITTGDYSPQHSREAKKPKNIFLTMVKYERNSLGEKQVPEFYCQTCAKIILKRIEKELINFSVSDARTTTLMMASNGWEYHWKKSEEEKKLKPSSEIWKKKWS